MSNWQQPPGKGPPQFGPPQFGPPPGPGGPPQFGPPQVPSPFHPQASSFYGPPPPPKSTAAWWVLGIFGALGLVACCGVCGGLAWVGINEGEKEIIAQLQDNAKLKEHIGDIQSLEMNLIASGEEDDSDVFVYDVQGTKGRGQLIVREGTGDDFTTIVEEATLKLPSGERVEVYP